MRINTVLKLADRKPLFGHPSGKEAKTHWLCFIKTHNAGLTGAAHHKTRAENEA